jgi:hypothetical protein
MITLGGVVAEIAIMGFGRPLLIKFDKDWLLLTALCSSFLRILSYALVPENQGDYIYFILAMYELICFNALVKYLCVVLERVLYR